MSSLEDPTSRPPRVRLNSGQTDLLIQGEGQPDRIIRQEASKGRSLIPERPPTASGVVGSHTQSSVPGTPDTPNFYAAGLQPSAQSLLPPFRSRSHRFRDDDHSGSPSPGPSAYSSRRTSWSSDGASRDPFGDSRTPSRAGNDEEILNTQTVSEKYNILPSAGLLLFPEDVEKDDYLHNPGPQDNERDWDFWNKRSLINLGGLVILTLGLLTLFIGYPVITFVAKKTAPNDPCRGDPSCIGSGYVPLLKNIRTGLIDPDTPSSARTMTGVDGKTLNLVFSDEFNKDGRTFYDGDDPYFQAVDLWYGVTQDLEWYDPDAVTTKDGVLELRFDAFQNHGLNYRSGMLQSWNKMCFQGGHLVASISMPGSGQSVGFWPGFWAMGNLGRPGYASTTDGLWPYSYHDVCDAGVTKNQSMTDGTSLLPGMRLPACSCVNEDHPSPGNSRSSPEIDVIEGSVGILDTLKNSVGVASQSAQFAPFDIWYQPDYNYIELYDPTVTVMNSYRGGPYQQAMSGVTNLNNEWYNNKAYQTYAFEYVPGDKGSIHWYVGSEKTWMMDARSVRPNGNVGQRVIPVEPMAVVMNFGMSDSFAALNYTGLATDLPATMRFDYIRIYQDPNHESVGCDPPGHPTTGYIARHPAAYGNVNLTSWHSTGYAWPKNALVDGCKAADESVQIVRPR